MHVPGWYEATRVLQREGKDESGIVRFTSLPVAAAQTIGSEFVARTYPAPQKASTRQSAPRLRTLAKAAASGNADSLRAYADALILWGKANQIGAVLAALSGRSSIARVELLQHRNVLAIQKAQSRG